MEELRIKEILKFKGLTMLDLSNILMINRVTLSNSLNGNPTLETLKKIASALEVNLSELFINCDKRDILGYIEYKNEIHKIQSIQDLENTYLRLKSELESKD